MPVAARIAGGSSKPARASTREIGKGLHSPFKIHTVACQLRIIAARTPVTNPQASAVTFRKAAANAVFPSTCAASRAEKNTIPASHRAQIGTGARFDAEKRWNTKAVTV